MPDDKHRGTKRTPRDESTLVSHASLPSLPAAEGFIPPHGGYQDLLSYQKALVVYDATLRFCDRFIDKRSRTHDQMVQAARSGKQNILEGSQSSGTSKETEIKLTNVARASLEELLEDYRDFMRNRGFEEWAPTHPYAQRLRRLNRTPRRKLRDLQEGRRTSRPGHLRQCHCWTHQSDHLPARPTTPPSRTGLSQGGRTARAHDPRPPRRPSPTTTRRPPWHLKRPQGLQSPEPAAPLRRLCLLRPLRRFLPFRPLNLDAAHVPPFQGLECIGRSHPGRCPGLVFFAPLGLRREAANERVASRSAR